MVLTAAQTLARPFAAAGATVRQMLFGRGRGWSWIVNRGKIDYRAEVGDPATNSIVGAVVGWISRNFPDAPVRVIRESDPNGDPIVRSQTGPGAMLRLLERPNSWYSGVLQWMATIVDFVIDGNAYWLKVRNASGRVVELWWIPQQFLEPRWSLLDPQAFIEWYEYRVNGLIYTIDPADVVHFRNGIDPDNPRKGRAPLKALFREVYTDEEASIFTASLLHNLGVPGVIIAPANTTGGGISLQTDPEAVKTKFMEKFGGTGRGEPLVLTAPTEVKVLSFNPQQMELRALRRIPEERVSAVLGVPAGVAGLGAGLDRNTFTNYGEANKAAYTQAVIPLQRLIAAELEVQLLPEFVSGAIETFDVLFDASATSAMAEAAGEVWKRAESAAGRGLITRAAFKRLTKQEVTPVVDDVYILAQNMSVVPAGTLQALPAGPTRQPAPAPAPAPALGPGSSAGGGGVALLEAPASAAVAAAAEVRCASCRSLLAELAAPPYRFTCRKCDAVTASDEGGS